MLPSNSSELDEANTPETLPYMDCRAAIDCGDVRRHWVFAATVAESCAFSSMSPPDDAAIGSRLVMGTRTQKRGDRRRRCTRGRSRAVVGMAANPSEAHQAGRHRAGQILVPACRGAEAEGACCWAARPLPVEMCGGKYVTAPSTSPHPELAQSKDQASRPPAPVAASVAARRAVRATINSCCCWIARIR